MTAAHTPGPWSHDSGIIPPDGPERYNTISAGDNSICEINEFMAEFKANARLIAAAPDLLESLQNLLASVGIRIDDPRISLFDAARAAIAKATRIPPCA